MSVNVKSSGPGFVEHGQLFGHRACIVALAPGAAATDVGVVAEEACSHGYDRIHIVAEPGCGAQIGPLRDALLAIDQLLSISGAFRPGDRPALARHLWDSVLVVADGDAVSSSMLEDLEVGAISVHGWPGSGTLQLIADKVDAPYGYFLVLPRGDIGVAKVWLSCTNDHDWQIIPYHPLNSTYEAAEIDQIVNGGG